MGRVLFLSIPHQTKIDKVITAQQNCGMHTFDRKHKQTKTRAIVCKTLCPQLPDSNTA